MKRSAGIIAVVILLVLGGAVLLTAGLFDRRMAIAQEDMAVLDFVDPKVPDYEQEISSGVCGYSCARRPIGGRGAG